MKPSAAARALDVQKPSDTAGAILEAWAQGFMVGALIILAAITFANMRRHVLLHKLILLELICGTFHGTFIFTEPPVYNWYLSVTAIFLNFSWSLHNVIAWMKNKPFLPRWGSLLYIWTVILVQPYWILEIVANFLYFSNTNNLFVYTRPYEALFRDPWWIFTSLSLFYNIKSRYEFGYVELMRVSPRFAVLLASMIVSICFIITDILAVTHVIHGNGLPDGINPFWKLAFVFKCLTDAIVLDDFKTALDRLKRYKMQQMGNVLAATVSSDGIRGTFSDVSDAEPQETALASMPSLRDWSKETGESDDMDLATFLRMSRVESIQPSRSGKG